MSIDVGICQDEGGKLPYYMLYTERKHIHSLEIIPKFWSGLTNYTNNAVKDDQIVNKSQMSKAWIHRGFVLDHRCK